MSSRWIGGPIEKPGCQRPADRMDPAYTGELTGRTTSRRESPHDSEAHREQVRNLWIFLCANGVDARIDRVAR
jgi:hypothetical protein